MDVIPDITGRLDERWLPFAPASHQIVGEARLFVRAERIGYDHFAKCHPTLRRVKSKQLRCERFGDAVSAERVKRGRSRSFAGLENTTGQNDPAAARVAQCLQDICP